MEARGQAGSSSGSSGSGRRKFWQRSAPFPKLSLFSISTSTRAVAASQGEGHSLEHGDSQPMTLVLGDHSTETTGLTHMTQQFSASAPHSK